MSDKAEKKIRRKPKTKSPVSLKDLNEEQIKAFQEISKNADLRKVLLLESHFQCNHSEYALGQKNENVNFSYGYTVREKEYLDEEGHGLIIFDWEVVATTKSGEEDCKVVEMTSTYAVHYGLPCKCDPDIVSLFLIHVGKVACYPYFRNQVSQKSWESSLELPILPVISA